MIATCYITDQNREHAAMAFNDNLRQLPGIDSILSIELSTPDGHVAATIENKPGQKGSLAVYCHLMDEFGIIHAAAARKGLELYAEHTADARSNPGKHPNIDRLLRIESGGAPLSGRIIHALP
jgi:hypothetical protein